MSTEQQSPPRDTSPVPLPIAPPAQPNLGNQLSAEELRFFETGELPSALTPPPAPAPTPEPVAAPAPQPRDETGRFVPAPAAPAAEPAAAPAAEYARVIAAEAGRAAAAEAQLSALQARLDELTKPKPPPAPDRNVDPLGALEHQIAEQTRLLSELRAKAEADMQARAEAEAHQAFVAGIRNMRAEFIKSAPDYDAAYSHLRASRLEELGYLGLNQQQAEQQIAQEEFALAASEIRKARNPVQTIYELAKKRGYQPKSAPATATSPEDKLSTILAAAEAGKGVDRGSLPPESELTLATARTASPTQLDKLTADDVHWKKFVGAKTDIF